MDGFFGELPIIGLFSGYLFHPSYLISRLDNGAPMVRVKKQPAFWEGRFSLEQIGNIDDGDQLRVMLSTLMMILLERRRG
jgi:hypothetical protein